MGHEFIFYHLAYFLFCLKKRIGSLRCDYVTKDCYAAATADDVVAVTGKWATTAPIEGLDMAKAVYGPVESINTGDMTVDEWQKQLVETWEKCADALEK